MSGFFTYDTIGGPSFNPNSMPKNAPLPYGYGVFKAGYTPPPAFGDYGNANAGDMGDMDPAEPDLPQIVADPTTPYEMPEMGTPAYDEWIASMGGSGTSPAGTGATAMQFDPTNYAHWLRGLGLFAKGALFGAPKHAGPKPEAEKPTVTQENTFDQGKYWDWMFKK